MPNEIDTEALRAALAAIFTGALNRAEAAEAERDALKAKLEEALKAWDYEYAKRTQAEDAWEVLRRSGRGDGSRRR